MTVDSCCDRKEYNYLREKEFIVNRNNSYLLVYYLSSIYLRYGKSAGTY